MGDAVDHQLIHQRFGGGAGLVERAHGRGPSNFAANLAKFRDHTLAPAKSAPAKSALALIECVLHATSRK
jgi:hypothetical protein